MNRPPRHVVALLVVLTAAACTPDARRGPSVGPVSPSASSGSPPAVASDVVEPHCPKAGNSGGKPRSSAKGTLPPAIEEVRRGVAAVRGLPFTERIGPEPVTPSRMSTLIGGALGDQYPGSFLEHRQRTLATIGAIPRGTSLRRAIVGYGEDQVTGFYQPNSNRLVFIGGRSLSPYARFTLAHELTHALDDQHFDLTRLDDLSASCRDDRMEAFLAVTEGDAVVNSITWAQTYLDAAELGRLNEEAASFGGPPAFVPEFVENQELFPYLAGQPFINALLMRGGQRAVNAAFRKPPASTEQVLHPDRYPSDAPQDVVIQDLSEELGDGWTEFDGQDVGEGWLRDLLRVRLSDDVAARAAAGWDGGRYAAWSNDRRTAVRMETVWDAPADAAEFASSMQRWIGARPGRVIRAGASVTVLFASDAGTLALLEALV